MYYVLCPSCQHPLQVSYEYVGHRVACSECEHKFEIAQEQILAMENTSQEEENALKEDLPDNTVSLSPPAHFITSNNHTPIESISSQLSSTGLKPEKIETISASKLPLYIAVGAVLLSIVAGVYTGFGEVGASKIEPVVSVNGAIVVDSSFISASNSPKKDKIVVVEEPKSVPIEVAEDLTQFKKSIAENLLKEQPENGTLLLLGDTSLKYIDYERDVFVLYTIDKVDVSKMKSIAMRPMGKEFLNYFMNDTTLMTTFWTSGSNNNPARAMEILYLIFKHDSNKDFSKSETYKNLAVACALTAWPDNYEIFDLYQTYVKNHKKGRLHKHFDALTAREMRYIVQPEKMQASDIEDLLQNHNSLIESYGGTCWKASYLSNNLFDDSIHGPHYYRPWAAFYGRHEGVRKIGGVCGSLSHYGMAAAKARGVLSITSGQPGHCAYVVRFKDNVWRIHYNVGGPTGMHMNMWGQYNFYYLDLIEAVFADTQAHQNSIYALIQGFVFKNIKKPELTIEPKSTLLISENRTKSVPLFSVSNAREVGPKAIDVNSFGVADNFAVQWKGMIHASDSQNTVICFGADDGAILKIDGKVVINDDGVHASNIKKQPYFFSQGPHQYEISYHQLGGDKKIEFKFEEANKDYNPKDEKPFLDAVALQPINYQAWQEYGNYLANAKGVTDAQWRNWAKQMAIGLKDYQESAWDLIKNYADKKIKADGGVEALAHFYADMFDILKQTNRPLNEAPRIRELLDYQFSQLGNNLNLMFTIFERTLESQAGSTHNYTQIVNWGGQRFMGDADLSKKYIATMGKVLEKSGGKGVSGFLKTSILEAAKRNDIGSFQALSDLSDKMRNVSNPKSTVKNYFTDPLLSNKGLLQTSGTSGFENPELYRTVISEGENLNFHTESVVNPWAIVQLPGDANVTGIYIRNVEGQNAWRSCPLIISVSEDKQKWEVVYTTPAKEVKNEWIIPLKTPKKARYIKVERPASAGQVFFHLRKILIYGKKLY